MAEPEETGYQEGHYNEGYTEEGYTEGETYTEGEGYTEENYNNEDYTEYSEGGGEEVSVVESPPPAPAALVAPARPPPTPPRAPPRQESSSSLLDTPPPPKIPPRPPSLHNFAKTIPGAAAAAVAAVAGGVAVGVTTGAAALGGSPSRIKSDLEKLLVASPKTTPSNSSDFSPISSPSSSGTIPPVVKIPPLKTTPEALRNTFPPKPAPTSSKAVSSNSASSLPSSGGALSPLSTSATLLPSDSPGTKLSARANGAWRDFEARYDSAEVQQDHLCDILLFPSNEISVVNEPREHRTVRSEIPDDLLQDTQSLDPFVRDNVEVFSSNWTYVRHSSDRTEEEEEEARKGSRITASKSELEAPSPRAQDKLRTMLEMQRAAKVSGTPTTAIDANFLTRPTELRFNEKRHELFATIALAQDRTADQVIGRPFIEHIPNQLLVECKQLEFQLGEIEPFYCSLALYDVKTKRKVSESFNFELNSSSLLHELEMLPNGSNLDRETTARGAIFTIPENAKAIYFILRVNKLLRPDNEKYTQAYMKPKSVKPKDLDKLKKETKELVIGVLQPFAWAAFPVLDKNDALISTQIVVDQIYPISRGGQFTDESICELMGNEKDKQKARAHLFGKFVADARKPPPEFPGRLTSSLVAVKPPTEDTSIALTKEIADFSLRRRPKMTYVNHLFVYPESCSFKYKHDNINLLIEVVLKADDKDVKTPGVNAIYGNLLGPKYLPSGSTSVLFKDKKPVFADEIKLELPGRLTPQHHLLFNLYHITADKKSRDKKSSAVLVGHAFHPIFRDGKIVKDLPRSISIASELPPSYLDVPENQIKWLEQKKICINFRTKVHSSIYAQDDFLPSFSKLCTETGSLKDWDFAMGSTTVDATANVRKVAPQVIMDHFPVIANQLFQVMCTRNETVSREAFLSLIHVLQTVERISDEKRDKNTLLFNYSRYLFKNVQRAPRFVYEEVAKSWLYFLQQKHNVFSANFNLSWFLFEIIAKSMILRWQSANHFVGTPRATWFPSEYLDVLKELARCLPASQFEMVNIQKLSFPFFLKELSYVIDRGVLFEMTHLYVTGLDSGDPMLAATGKQIFLKVITNFDNYVPLNMPLEEHIGQVAEITQDFSGRHFLAGLLLAEVASGLAQVSSTKFTLLRQNISILRNILKKHEVDPRLNQDPKKMERIVSIYFPFILAVLEKFPDLRQTETRHDKEEAIQKEAFDNVWLCFFFVIKYCSKGILVEWWKKETQKRHIVFFELLLHCLQKFKGKTYEEEMGFTAVEAVALFMEHFEDDLQIPESPLLEKLFSLLQEVLACDHTELLLATYSPVLRFVAHTFSKPLFDSSFSANSALIEVLNLAILRHCNFGDNRIRGAASGCFYLLLQKNFEVMGDIHRLNIQSTVAISRLVGESQLREYGNLNSSLNSIVQHAKANAPDMANQIEELVGQIFSLIRYNAKIAENAFDPELIADLYYKISLSYFNSPNLRVTWLNNLAAYHTTNGNFEESAQAKIHVAYLVVQYLQRNGHSLPLTKDTFISVSPVIHLEPGLPESNDQSLFQSASNIWSVAGLIKQLQEAETLLEKAGHFELAMEMYSILSLIFKKERMWAELIESLQFYKTMAEKVVEVNKDLRLFSRFYRVGFYGPLTEELDGKEFIYKRDQKVNLAVVQQQLKDIFSKKAKGVENIIILPNKDIEREKLDPTKFYLQIANVELYSDPDENRVSAFDRNFNVNRFIFEAAFATTGKAQTETSQQQKKKIVFQSELAFPYLRNRLEVQDKKEIVLSPIENAVELIAERIQKLRVELNSRPARLNSLQQVLQGSVVPMVNEGPLKICEIFLRKDLKPGTYPEEHLVTLRKDLGEFVRACGFAIALNNSLIGPEHKPFHNMIETHYKTLKSKIMEYLD